MVVMAGKLETLKSECDRACPRRLLERVNPAFSVKKSPQKLDSTSFFML